MGVSRDTEQLAALTRENDALRARLAVFENAVGHMHQGLCMFDPSGRIALCNDRYAEVIQLPAEQIRPGLSARELVSLVQQAGYYPADIAPEQLEQHLWANLEASADARVKLERGGRTYAVMPACTAEGYWIATFEDVSAQVAAEDALRESEARLRAILDAMPDCVKIFDEAGRMVHINPQGLELLQAPDLESLSGPGYMAVPEEYRA